MNNKEELIQLCEKNGWKHQEKDGAFIVSEKDIWDGVEFISSNVDGEIYRISEIEGDKIWLTKGTYIKKNEGSPSTESAYVDQLKKKAIELFGEIKEGDKFDRPWNYGVKRIGYFTNSKGKGFQYYKRVDVLTFDEVIIYENGQWATKVPKEEPAPDPIPERPCLIDFYAASAMIGSLASGQNEGFLKTHAAEWSFQMANAMLEERKKHV